MSKSFRVENMRGHNGREIANQFIVWIKDEGTYFQSYDSIIALKPYFGKIKLDATYWDYSRTTGKYRNLFLGETKRQTQAHIDNGDYELTNLN